MAVDARFYPLALLAVILILCLQTVLTGAVPQVGAAHDSAIFYDGGWRAYCGLRPHIDFYTGLGPAIYLYVATGYCLFGLTIHSLAYMNAIMLALVACTAWFSLHGRVTDFWRFWACLLIGLCSMAPHAIRAPAWEFGYAMLYNRQGCAVMMLLIMVLYCPRGSMDTLQARWVSLLIGLSIAFLLFLKINFFAVGCVSLAAYFVIERDRWIHLKYLVAGFAFCSLAFLAYLKFDVVAMFSDLAIASRAKSTYFNRYSNAHIATLVFSLPWLYVYAFLVWCGLRYSRDINPGEEALQQKWREVALGILVCGVSMFIIMTNGIFGDPDHPVLVAFSIVLCARFIGQRELNAGAALFKRQGSGALAGACLLVTTCITVIPYISCDALSIMSARYFTHGFQHMEDPAIRDMRVYMEDEANEAYLRKTNDGIKLLKQEDLKGKTVLVLHFSSIIPFAVRCPPEGGSAFWDYNNSFTRDAHPSPERTLRNASYVMISREKGHLFAPPQLGDCYLPYIKAHYTHRKSSDEWELWERNAAQDSSR